MARRLNDRQKLFIVQGLACFRTPSEVRDALAEEEEIGIQVDPRHIQFYDPTALPWDKRLPEKWKLIFWETRKAYLENTAAVGAAHQRYRLEVIQEVLDRQRKAKIRNDNAILQTVEQAAKEVGGLFTNKREHSGPNGGAIPLNLGDQSKELAGKMFRKLVESGKTPEEARAGLILLGVNERDIPAI
ncbi:MAG TPA: DUF2280 domain-containing protein [Pyrinomonadaceae bacterium]|jgi:hypothetical protein